MSSIPIYGGPLCIYFREFHNRYSIRPTIQEKSQIELWIKSFPQSAVNYPREEVCREFNAAISLQLPWFILYGILFFFNQQDFEIP